MKIGLKGVFSGQDKQNMKRRVGIRVWEWGSGGSLVGQVRKDITIKKKLPSSRMSVLAYQNHFVSYAGLEDGFPCFLCLVYV